MCDAGFGLSFELEHCSLRCRGSWVLLRVPVGVGRPLLRWFGPSLGPEKWRVQGMRAALMSAASSLTSPNRNIRPRSFWTTRC